MSDKVNNFLKKKSSITSPKATNDEVGLALLNTMVSVLRGKEGEPGKDGVGIDGKGGIDG